MRKVEEDMSKVWKKKVQVEDTECGDNTKCIITLVITKKL